MTITDIPHVVCTRRKCDARRCGLYEGYGPAWVWKYRYELSFPGYEPSEVLQDAGGMHEGRSHAARRLMQAGEREALLFEQWPNGRRFKLGPRGGWVKVGT